MLGYGASQRILNGNDSNAHGTAFQAVKDFSGAGAGDDLRLRNHLPCGFVAEGASLALDSDFHGCKLTGTADRKQIFLEDKRIHAVRVITGNGLHVEIAVALVESDGGKIIHGSLQI